MIVLREATIFSSGNGISGLYPYLYIEEETLARINEKYSSRCGYSYRRLSSVVMSLQASQA